MIPIQDLQQEIESVEERIHQRTLRITSSSQTAYTTLRHGLTSPTSLILAAAVGFTVGRLMNGTHATGPVRLSGAWSFISRSLPLLIRAPTLLWLARLFRAQRPDETTQTAAHGAKPL